MDKATLLSDAVQAAATAALAAEKKEKSKEIKLASKSSILANKKKMNNVLTMWKQRSHEGQATRIALDDNPSSSLPDDKPFPNAQSTKKFKSDAATSKETPTFSSGTPVGQAIGVESPGKARPVSNSSGGSLMGVIRVSGRSVSRVDASYVGSSGGVSTSSANAATAVSVGSSNADITTTATPFRTDASALGSYAPAVTSGSAKRRFSEMPLTSASSQKEQPQTAYRDRAAERRSLYGSSSSTGDDLPDGFGDSSKHKPFAFELNLGFCCTG